MSILHVDLKIPGGTYKHEPLFRTTTFVGYVPSNPSSALQHNWVSKAKQFYTIIFLSHPTYCTSRHLASIFDGAVCGDPSHRRTPSCSILGSCHSIPINITITLNDLMKMWLWLRVLEFRLT